MSPVAVRRLVSGDGESFRDLRLRALKDAPYAFASSYALEVDRPVTWWDEIARESESGRQGAVFVAVDGSEWLGMAGGYLQRDDPGVAGVWGTWVSPRARGHRLGEELMAAVIGWAREIGATRIDLSVTEKAQPARALYLRLGFADTGVTEPLPSDPSITEMCMTLAL